MRIEEILKVENGYVNVKELYVGLGLNESNWSKWYPRNIVDNEFFKENVDWRVLVLSTTTEKGGQVGKNFEVNLRFAQHIAMMSRSKYSHQYRDYFIQCEEKLKEEKELNLQLQIKNEQLQKEIKEKELSQVKAASMLLSHKDKLGLTKGYLYPILRELGVTDKNKFKAHSLIKQLLIGKYENVKKDKEFNTAQFIKDYKTLAEQLQEENHSYFPDKNQTSFWDSII